MGCTPLAKLEPSFESKETMDSPKLKDKEKDKVFRPPKSRVIKSRFISKMLKFRSDLSVIYEISNELEASIITE